MLTFQRITDGPAGRAIQLPGPEWRAGSVLGPSLPSAMGVFKTPECWVPLLMAAIAYEVTLTLAWIIDGFAKPKP